MPTRRTFLIHTAAASVVAADQYGFGKVEATFGEVLKRSPELRNKIVIQTKCGVVFEPPSAFLRVDCSRKYIVSAAEASLRRLGMNHLDILLLHWPDALVRPEEVAQAFNELKQSGKVRYFGVSNHTAAQIELLRKHLRQPLVANQISLGLGNSYSMAGRLAALWYADRGPRAYSELPDTLDYCRLQDIQIQAYSPLRGSLPFVNPPATATPQINHAAQVLADLANKKNTTWSAIALTWLLHHPAGIVPIIGTTKPEQVNENCEADGINLTPEEWYTLFHAAAGVEPGKVT